jgi:hypothetical protein
MTMMVKVCAANIAIELAIKPSEYKKLTLLFYQIKHNYHYGNGAPAMFNGNEAPAMFTS